MGLVAVLTMTFGNLVAIQQSNIKRLLAYSSIAQAGYVMVGLTLLTEETTPAMRDNLVQWMNWSPFKLSGCQECKTLPQCMGGCPLMAFQQEGEIKKGYCSELRHNLRETVATYYLGIKEKQAMDQLTSSLHQVIPDLVPAASSGTPTK